MIKKIKDYFNYFYKSIFVCVLHCVIATVPTSNQYVSIQTCIYKETCSKLILNVPNLPYLVTGDDDFPRNRLQYLREIGRGWFGRVSSTLIASL